MWKSYIIFLNLFNNAFMYIGSDSGYYVSPSIYMTWPNATIPFYINREHFDQEQSLSILTALALFSYKTCLKFKPLFTPPSNEHVMIFENPQSINKCVPDSSRRPDNEPQRVTLGYECLQSPLLEMSIMKALGLPFEHNRSNRDTYVDVQFQNLEPDTIPLYKKEPVMPLEFQQLPYDYDSVLHFGDRDYSKTGHKTIILKDDARPQNRISLTPTDLKKIEIVYGAECRKRDRQEKIELCLNLAGAARKKRDAEYYPPNINLRVNRDIKPPTGTDDPVKGALSELGIREEVQGIVDKIYQVSAKALQNTRGKYCNITKNLLRKSESVLATNDSKTDIVGVIDSITSYVQNMVDNALMNKTVFCAASENMNSYQRQGCYNWYDCPKSYKSTKSGPVKYSTKHRPIYHMSTMSHRGPHHIKQFARSSNITGDENVADSTDMTTENRNKTRRKRSTVAEVTPNTNENRNEETSSNAETNISTQSDENTSKDARRRYKIKSSEELEESTEGRPRNVKLSRANREFYDERKWPNNVVPIIIQEIPEYDTDAVRARLEEVNDILKAKTCVRLKEIRESERRKYKDYLVLDTSADYVTGRVGGRQVFGSLELYLGGQHIQHAAMMVMAMLGFYFELARHDRDKYVRVHLRHVRPDKLHHFEKIRSDGTLPFPYDYKSATHPAWQFWRKVGRTGISSVATYKSQDPDGSLMKSLGQNNQLLSKTDILKINSVYGTKCLQLGNQPKIRKGRREKISNSE